MTKQLEQEIFSRLPQEAQKVVKSDPKQQKKVSIIVAKIFEDYGEDIRALARS